MYCSRFTSLGGELGNTGIESKWYYYVSFASEQRCTDLDTGVSLVNDSRQCANADGTTASA
jgi:hypothetical protein